METDDLAICSYGCATRGAFKLKNGKYCCSPSPSQCVSVRNKIKLSSSEKSVRLEHSTELCSYGCGREASYFYQKSRKYCCESFTQKCPAIRKKTSDAHIGMGHTGTTKEKLREHKREYFGRYPNSHPWIGRHHTEETKEKIREKNLGRKHSLETIKKFSEQRKGSLNPNWRGGISKEPYCQEWNEEFRGMIKDRDFHECRNPFCRQNSNRILVHHIDYDKKNCLPNNLITLCNSCNSRANFHREHWGIFYQRLVQIGV